MFLNRINEHLSDWRQYWNNHKLRTEKHMSPNSILADNAAISKAIHVDIEDLSSSDDNEDDGNPNAQVVLHPLKCPISPESLALFKGRFNCFIYLNHDSNEAMSAIFLMHFVTAMNCWIMRCQQQALLFEVLTIKNVENIITIVSVIFANA